MMFPSSLLAWLYWNPSRELFTIPFINRPIVWYGLWFAFGFMIGYIILIPIFQRRLQQTKHLLPRDIAHWETLIAILRQGVEPFTKHLTKKARQALSKFKKDQMPDEALQTEILSSLNAAIDETSLALDRNKLDLLLPGVLAKTNELAQYLVDRLTWFVVIGTIVGARLGHIIFYDWDRYLHHPAEIIQVWKGGLASHGGVVGILLALWFYHRKISSRFPEFSFVSILDFLVIPSAFAGSCIRLGNFFNQEILGTATSLPWGVFFADPFDGTSPLVRHPVQLYESASYLAIFIGLWMLWEKRAEILRPGMLSGIFFITLFGARFVLEYFKMPQSAMVNESWIQTGQLLSIPFIIMGAGLIYYARERGSKAKIVSSTAKV